jgi:cell division control protein 42
MPSIKCVVIGDAAVGKTCMLISYTRNDFPAAYVPTVFDIIGTSVRIDNREYVLNLFDTAGEEAFDRLRPMSYADADVFLVCYSIVEHASFENIRNVWIPDIRRHRPHTPFIIVGTKIDLRDNLIEINRLSRQGKGRRPLSADAGHALAKEFGAVRYLECSALTQQGLKAVFDAAIMTTIRPQATTRSVSRCAIL